MPEYCSLKGKNAIITGATRGIGLAIAKGFLACGATVTVCSRKPQNVQSAVAELGHVDKVLGTAVHVAKNEDLERLIQEAEERFGPVNVLVNNAGTNPYYGPIVDSPDWSWDKTMAVNLKAPYILSCKLGKKMMAQGAGSILNIASIAGLRAAPNQGIYSITKAALIMLTKVMAREMGPAGVRVNCICPGLFKTELSRGLWENDQILANAVSSKALGRIGDVNELVSAAIYFTSDTSSFTTGAVLQVDGGMVM